jgi:2-oxoglutarate dehydrogenase E2 component (dihydrolipoamide succinyltransferase)
MPTNVTVPVVGESIKTVILSRWLRKPGEPVQKGQGVAEIDSDKASMEVPAPEAGVLSEQLAAEGEEVAIGAVIARIDAGAAAGATANAAPVVAEKAAPPAGAPKAGPAARQAAAAEGVDLREVQGSGRRGQITRADVERAADRTGESTFVAPLEPAKAEAPVTRAKPAPSADRMERVPMTPLRRTVARRLVEAQTTAAMLTTFNEVDMGYVMALRKKYQDGFVEKHGVKLGFMSFFVKAAIEALKAFPAVNAEIQGNDILYKYYYDIGVAVSGPKGLVVPVLRDADRLSFAETEKAIGDLGKKAKDNKLLPADFEGGTFTISNGGVFGSMLSTPILNPPQVGILGMHNIVDRPVARNGEVVVRPVMYLALTYDHRIIDGREAVSFLVRIKDLIEAPERILLEV